MNYLLKNATLINPAGELTSGEGIDCRIEDGVIKELGPGLAADGAETIELNGAWLCPGLIDLHVHLRTPGQEHKETLATGLAAAAAGGFTTVFAMPNTEPALDSPALIRDLRARAAAASAVRLIPVGAATIGRQGKQLAPMSALKEAGCRAVSDDGSPIADAAVMRAALGYAAQLDLPLFDHAETPEFGGACNEGPVSARWGFKGKPAVGERIAVERDIALAEDAGARLHLCHLSTKGALDAVKRAKADGNGKLTAEAAPHHFALTDAAVLNLDSHAKMNPPLRAEADRQAVLKAIADGTIDCLATDHAPHAPDEKGREFADCPDGITGLETAVALALEFLVTPGLVAPARLVELMSVNPARIGGLEDAGRIAVGLPAYLTVIDPRAAWRYDAAAGKSKGRNSPFSGRNFSGRAILTVAAGTITHRI